MINRWVLFFLALFPMLAMADTISFTPPASDYSVVFLGNIFGVVDGVLNGTGSQMFGVLMGVFNSAVLALGGIIVMYIILVSTLNTAHEGEMLGKKWSSIWVPIRTTMGLALLIPKASGYCVMQIFVMWVVVQGVGVADKIWGAALDYLNQGGVIIHANMNPAASIGAGSSVATGAATILYGQVCMIGLQKQLETKRTNYINQLEAKPTSSGPCSGTPTSIMQGFCDNDVPDFLSSVDPLAVQTANDRGGPPYQTGYYEVLMPNFDTSSVYSALNGICGTIRWSPVQMTVTSTSTEDNVTTTITTDAAGNTTTVKTNTQTGAVLSTSTSTGVSTLSSSDLDTIRLTRAMAVTQMYLTLSSTSKSMVMNDPQLTATSGDTSMNASTVAQEQFGVPYTSGFTVCASSSDACPSWGADPSTTASILFQGSEFQNAIADYNTVMAPTLKLIADAADSSKASDARAFIQNANNSGWIMAGSYFYDLVNLNGSATSPTTTDTGSGLDKSEFTLDNINGAFASDGTSCTTAFGNLCVYLNSSKTAATQVIYLINGSAATNVNQPVMTSSSYSTISGSGASTAYGFVTNGMIIDLPDQPGVAVQGAQFTFPPFSVPDASIGRANEPCKHKIFSFCWDSLPGMIANVFIDLINTLLKYVFEYVQVMLNVMIIIPVTGIVNLFIGGMTAISVPGVNPILALATMGMNYIDFAMTTWMALALAAVVGSFMPTTFALLTCGFPLILSWLGVMLGIAFVTAYYIPFLPYMLFTFGAIAWLISVIEAMVAAPIVALGVAHPEGHDALGKSEQGLMILMNVFLRPAMMIVGYITGIALSYVGVWVMNAGFQHVLTYLQSGAVWGSSPLPWTVLFGGFFSSLIYTGMYLTIVQQAFTLIAAVPDKVLRWIGGHAETSGSESARWAEESKGQVKEAGGKTMDGAAQGLNQGIGTLGKKLSASGGEDSASKSSISSGPAKTP